MYIKYFKIMALKYKSILAKAQVSEASLPNEIKEVIEQLSKIQTELEDVQDEGNVELVKQLAVQVNDLDTEICDLLADEFDDETEEDDSEAEIKENILKSLVKSGITEVSAKKLAEYGYPSTDQIGTGEKVGKFRLTLVQLKFMKPYFKIELMK